MSAQSAAEIIGLASRPHLVAAAEADAVGSRAVEALAAAGYDVVRRTPPEANAYNMAAKLLDELGIPTAPNESVNRLRVANLAHALTEYGDQRAREAQSRTLDVIEAIRRHIRSFEPGTLVGSELNVACELEKLDGDVWKPWTVPGEVEIETPPEADVMEWARIATRYYGSELTERVARALTEYGNQRAREARQEQLDEGYCMACGLYHRVGNSCSAVDKAVREARAAAIEELKTHVFNIRDLQDRSLDWCNACNAVMGYLQILADAPSQRIREAVENEMRGHKQDVAGEIVSRP